MKMLSHAEWLHKMARKSRLLALPNKQQRKNAPKRTIGGSKHERPLPRPSSGGRS